MAKIVAIVEDDAAIRANYADMLKKHGYQVSAYADRGRRSPRSARGCPISRCSTSASRDEPDGGFALCRELRALSAALPIIFLTARDSDFDIVSGLRMGADDYLTKDASLPHLLARISALFRRADLLREPPAAEEIARARRADARHEALRGDLERRKPVDLTLTEFWLVHCARPLPGHVKNREQLMSEAHIVVDDATITSHVKRIRRKFQAVDPAFAAIDTVYGLGYRWNSLGALWPESQGRAGRARAGADPVARLPAT